MMADSRHAPALIFTAGAAFVTCAYFVYSSFHTTPPVQSGLRRRGAIRRPRSRQNMNGGGPVPRHDDAQPLQEALFYVGEATSMRNSVIHRGIACDTCNKPIKGIRYRCANCADFDLCSDCEASQPQPHEQTHIFYKIRVPAPYLDLRPLPVIYPGDPDPHAWRLDENRRQHLQLATTKSKEDIDALWNQFRFIANRKGVLDKAGFDRAFLPRYTSFTASPSLVFDRLFALFDPNQRDEIDFECFVRGMDELHSADRMTRHRLVFRFYDFDDDGYISEEDLQQVFMSEYAIQKEAFRHQNSNSALVMQHNASLIRSSANLSSGFAHDMSTAGSDADDTPGVYGGSVFRTADNEDPLFKNDFDQQALRAFNEIVAPLFLFKHARKDGEKKACGNGTLSLQAVRNAQIAFREERDYNLIALYLDPFEYAIRIAKTWPTVTVDDRLRDHLASFAEAEDMLQSLFSCAERQVYEQLRAESPLWGDTVWHLFGHALNDYLPLSPAEIPAEILWAMHIYRKQFQHEWIQNQYRMLTKAVNVTPDSSQEVPASGRDSTSNDMFLLDRGAFRRDALARGHDGFFFFTIASSKDLSMVHSTEGTDDSLRDAAYAYSVTRVDERLVTNTHGYRDNRAHTGDKGKDWPDWKFYLELAKHIWLSKTCFERSSPIHIDVLASYENAAQEMPEKEGKLLIGESEVRFWRVLMGDELRCLEAFTDHNKF